VSADVRRADWRFLLPDPGLGRVAYVPPHEPELAAALITVGSILVLVATPADVPGHDVVVVTGARVRAVAAAHPTLRHGGWLYAEVSGPRARAWRRALGRCGFDEIDAYWLWPDARSCREIVPLERDALLCSLARRDPGARLRLRARAAALLVRAGLLPLAMRRVALVARWP
jgi:hypothetical protein